MPEDEKLPVKLSLPLEFQQEIFRELREEDALVVFARGLGLLRIVTNLLHSYDAAGDNLIIIVGAEERENLWIGESLAEHAVLSMSAAAKGLTTVNTEAMNVGTRELQYKNGGVFSVTSRILVVDLLSNLLDPSIITGMVVLHADRVVATSLEAFILRIYRQKNKTGFLKAFSDNPEPFTTGFAPLTAMMRNMFLRRPSLWPRFQVNVAKSLEGQKRAEVIEIDVPMTEAMNDIQLAIQECIEISIQDLRKTNAGIDLEDWSFDSALHKNFDTQIRRQLDPVWHRVSFRTRQIVRDLTQLRQILNALLTYDAVSFHKYLDTVRAASAPPPGSTRQNQSPWLFLDAADTLFQTARRRVYTGNPRDVNLPAAAGSEFPENLRPVLEEQPKWKVLADILDEIERDNYFNPVLRDDSNGTILIMGGDYPSCRQIKEYLQTKYVKKESNESAGISDAGQKVEDESSASFMMRRKLRNYLSWKKDFVKVSESLFAEDQKQITAGTESKQLQAKSSRPPPNKRRRVRGGAGIAAGSTRTTSGYLAGDRDAHVQSLLNDLEPTELEAAQKDEIGADPLHNAEDFYELYEMRDVVIVHPYDGDMDERILEEIRPRYVIMYEPDLAFVRRVEVYRSSHTDRQIRTYFMYYGGSVEEQKYLSTVRREKNAFTKLIRERGSMALTLTTDAHGVEDPQEQFLRTINTRIAGGGRLHATAVQPIVVIDVREFRSSLPSLIHGRAMQCIPCTLTVGDYVLTPSICVERKSVRDLISSFSNGRLYNQAETMLQHYKNPFLLIEFDQNKSFTLEPFADYSSGGASSLAKASSLNPSTASDLQTKLVILTLTFPRLRIIWSSSPYQTAEIFEELKKQQDEPDPLTAVQLGLDGADAEEQTFAQTPLDMLRAVPGVGEKTLQRLTLEVGSIRDVANMEDERLNVLVGKEAGRQIHRFFNRDVLDD